MAAPRQPTDFVHAILTVGERYCLQLRDDKPGIAAPGRWSLPGGHVDHPETPAQAVRREVREEMDIDVPDLVHVVSNQQQLDGRVRLVDFFAASIDELWGRHRVCEGQALELFTLEEAVALDLPDFIEAGLRECHASRST